MSLEFGLRCSEPNLLKTLFKIDSLIPSQTSTRSVMNCYKVLLTELILVSENLVYVQSLKNTFCHSLKRGCCIQKSEKHDLYLKEGISLAKRFFEIFFYVLGWQYIQR